MRTCWFPAAPGGAVTRRREACSGELPLHARAAVNLACLGVDRAHALGKFVVGDGVQTRLSEFPRVVSAAAHLQHAAKGFYWVFALLLPHEGEPYVLRRAKKSAAFFANSSSVLSSRSCFFRRSFSAVRLSPLALVTTLAAKSRHRPSVPTVTPNSSATSPCERPLSSCRSASRRYSGA